MVLTLILLGGMSLLAALILAVPLFDRRKLRNDADFTLAVYRDQLLELNRDERLGLISGEEARAAQLEIERRVLALADAPPYRAAREPSGRVLALLAVVLPLAGFGLYLAIGSPFLPSAPLRPEAVAAARLAAAGQAKVLAEAGMVGPAAAADFHAALRHDALEPTARFFLALEKAQKGEVAGALADWLALEREAPADAPWSAVLAEHIDKAAQRLGKPALAAQATSLAERLAARPEDVELWRRLGRTRLALGELPEAAAALARAVALAPARLDVQLDYADALLLGAGASARVPPPGFAETVARIRALDPAHPLGLYYAGLLARAAGKTEEARSLWLRVMARLPVDAPQRRTLQEEIDSLGP